MSSSKTGEAELKPCPFCGEAGVLETWESGARYYEFISCFDCDASTDNHCIAGTGEAADKWNTRTSDALQEQNRKLREACETARKWFKDEMEIGYSEEMKAIANQLRAALKDGQL